MSDRRCFIIGPMSDDKDERGKKRLDRLKSEIVSPVLEEVGNPDGVIYRVNTPFDFQARGATLVMNDILHAIDRADIVVADITGGNPNVFYELGIVHALGRPCVTVAQSGASPHFDLAHYRFIEIDLDAMDPANQSADPERAISLGQRALRAPLDKAHRDADDWRTLESPVIDFFRAPITYLSPASSLADGYCANFVEPVVDAITRRRGVDYVYDIGIGKVGAPPSRQMDEHQLLNREERSQLSLLILIPDRLQYAHHEYTQNFRGHLYPALVEHGGRALPLWATQIDGQLTLIDVPTTLNVLSTTVERRLRFPGRDNDTESLEIQTQEIRRFTMCVRIRFDEITRRSPKFRNFVKVGDSQEFGYLTRFLE